ncbi:hypothetical protein CCMSSC00406_0001804 [Pleurotus cornucopiae]|uniref:Uncharacterized protein n=1 Tax=Pleurotus cornucopiae TaxID=5321 RepID=A0ACB7J4Y0_PLECO|nr:hypothetical protein CCMSSC00406_0001804 [Pleurotus cornucopiae]
MLIFPPLLLALGASAATFTVFDVAAGTGDLTRPTGSIISVRPLGVGSDGTTYEVAAALPTGDLTVTATVVADGTMNKANAAFSVEGAPPFTVSSGCTWGTGKDGVCKLIGEGTMTATTYSGTITPLFTVTVDDSSATASPTSTSNAAISVSVGTRSYIGIAVASVLYLL